MTCFSLCVVLMPVLFSQTKFKDMFLFRSPLKLLSYRVHFCCVFCDLYRAGNYYLVYNLILFFCLLMHAHFSPVFKEHVTHYEEWTCVGRVWVCVDGRAVTDDSPTPSHDLLNRHYLT